ncbi:SnoK protein [Luteitalea sp. TBR-22]|uniref:phytanoyl-CoA dioxygenase family protein n=1 Tax=Luteitalea sp. TBR-22 TaxID=2802971 RepID=UPI001AF3E4E3|nr:phytanoyl-CoA dioxygenase family protein [Luteitalea sp. TBR-22]BCS35523.1 SnoK protein [Luteitalea sp. TBR-22]
MLSREEMSRFARDGFLVVPEALGAAAIEEVRALLDPLFTRFRHLPTDVRRDLAAAGPTNGAAPRSAEIERPSRLDPRLRATEAFRRCREMAEALGGRAVGYSFDHAIYKAPFNDAETPWHQDHAYNGHRRLLRTFHFWIPLQPVTVESGCMQFIPGSQSAGLLEHGRRGDGHVRAVEDAESSRAVVCPLPLGGLTVHHPLTLHYTGPNRTGDVRRAWIVHFGPWGRLAKWHPSIVVEKVARLATGLR